jgi:formylglycine-generating enzyme required for sulfatase activity
MWLGLFLTPALVGLSRGDEESGPTDPVNSLIKQLGSSAFVIRQDASKKLVALGDKAIPALRQAAARSDDPEVRRRAAALMMTILPNSRKSTSIGLELMRIDAGYFHMGSPTSEKNRRPDEDRHEVRIREPFYLGVYEVTQEEYNKVMSFNPSWFTENGPGKDNVRGFDTSRFPVERVTWYDAIEFCNLLSKRDGFAAYYKIAGKNVTIAGGNGYRLPTEAEWEFACRAHTEGPYYFRNNPGGREGNFKSSIVPGGYGGGPAWQALNRTTKAGSYPANAYGLYDMLGNVGEWCWDYYDKSYYVKSPGTDPPGPPTGDHRVVRGGSWLVTEGSCRSASRFMLAPGERDYNVGFRVARSP